MTHMQLPSADGLRQSPSAAVEGQRAREQHVQEHPRRPYVHRLAVLPPLQDLRCHEVRTTNPTCKISVIHSLGATVSP